MNVSFNTWLGSQRGSATFTTSLPILRFAGVEGEVSWRVTYLAPASPQQASLLVRPSTAPHSVLEVRLELFSEGDTVEFPALTCHQQD